MKKCKDIENNLPLYLEGVLSDAEKQAIEDHLAICAGCRKELAYLQKTGQLVDHLPQVEEPPWFQQRIMARVREEAAKKSFLQKWFYPLRIKIPIQIMATMVIAILAVYIYRSGDEQVKEILPGAVPPAVEMKKEQTPVAEIPQARDIAEPMVLRKKAAVREEARQDKQVMGNVAAGSGIRKSDIPEFKPKAVDEMDSYRAKGLTESKDKAYPSLQVKQNELESAKMQMMDQERKVEDSALLGVAKKKESYKMAAPAAPRSMATSAVVPPRASVFLRVENLNAAVAEVEKILAGYSVKIKSRQILDHRVIVQAEVSARYFKDVLTKLKGLGQAEEKVLPTDVGEKDVTVVIEIAGP